MHHFDKVSVRSTCKCLMVASMVAQLFWTCAHSKDSLPVGNASGSNDARTVDDAHWANDAHSLNDASSASDASAAIPTVLQTQADAWNAGNLDQFMSVYVKSPNISFVSSDGELHGYDELESRYRKKYGTKRDTMGTLTFSELHIDALGESNALCVGHWHLVRAGQHPMQGIFSLVFTKTNGMWKIIHDHTSLTK